MAAGDLFDTELERLVEDFQRSRRLAVDGVAGLQTLLVLDAALGAPGTPDTRRRAARVRRMSFILDALRKSEIERQRQSGPSIAEIPIAREDRRLPVALVAIGVLLAVNVGVLLFFLLRDGGATEPEAAAPVAATNAPAVARPAPAPTTASPPIASPVPLPAPGGNPMSGAMQDPGFDPYAQVAPDATLAPDAPDPTLLPAAPTTQGPAASPMGNRRSRSRIFRPTRAPACRRSPSICTSSPTTWQNAPCSSTDGATRRERPSPKVRRLEEITRDGAVLSFRGRRFLLPRQ